MSNIGYATLSVIPSFRGGAALLAKQVVPEMALAGKAGGAAFSKAAVLGVGGVAALAVGVGIAATKMGAAFQTATTLLVTGAGESEKSIKGVRDGLIKMAPAVGMGPTALAKAMFLVESAGFHGARGLVVMKAAAEGAKIGGVDATVVADGLTTAMVDYGFATGQASTVTSKLIATVAAGKTNMGDLSSSLSNVLPFAASLKIGFDDVLGAMATMTSQGINAAKAATMLKFGIMALGNETSKGSKALDAIGLSSEQVHTDLGTKGLSGTLAEVTDAIGKKFPAGSAAATKALSDIMGGTRGMGVALALSGKHAEAFTANIKKVSGATTEAGGHVRGWALTTQDLNFQIDRAKARVAAWAVTIGGVLVPGVTAAVKAFNGSATAIGSSVGWLNKNRTAVRDVAGVITALLLPALVKMAATAVASGAETAAVWAMLKVDAIKSAAAQVAAWVAVNAAWIAAAAAAFAAGAAISAFEKATDRAVPNVQALTKSLLDLGNAQTAATLAKQLGDLGDAADRLNPGALQGFADEVTRFENSGGILATTTKGIQGLVTMGQSVGDQGAKGFREATAAVGALDGALANIVTSGSAGQARKAFADLAASQHLSGSEQKTLLAHMPQYTEALAGAANTATLAARSTKNATDATKNLSGADKAAAAASKLAAAAVKSFNDAMKAQRSAAIGAAGSAIAWQASIDDARKALDANGRTLDITTEKGRANRTALLDMAGAWNSQSAAAKNTVGAHHAAIAEFVKAAHQMGMNTDKARAYARKLFEIPTRRATVIIADTSQATARVSALRGIYASLPTSIVTSIVTSHIDKFTRQTGGHPGRAAGGPVWAGASYLVGERGPEVLTMGNRAGVVTPNKSLGSMQQFDHQTAELARLRAAVDRLNERLAHLPQDVYDGTHDGAKAGIDGRNRVTQQRRRAGL
jgi:TP901 family phage tail tape measure protein